MQFPDVAAVLRHAANPADHLTRLGAREATDPRRLERFHHLCRRRFEGLPGAGAAELLHEQGCELLDRAGVLGSEIEDFHGLDLAAKDETLAEIATCCHMQRVIQRERFIKLVAGSGATMRTVSLIAAALIFSLAAIPHAMACSCANIPPAKVAFSETSEVFLAQAVYVTHLAVPDDPDHGWSYLEIAAFRVTEVWKGRLKTGDIIQAQGWYGAGGCGRKVAASPQKPFTPGEQSRAVPYLGQGSWIIYRVGNEPYRLSVCSRTKALDVGGDAEATLLRQLARTGRG
jgi:hypothetical protein